MRFRGSYLHGQFSDLNFTLISNDESFIFQSKDLYWSGLLGDRVPFCCHLKIFLISENLGVEVIWQRLALEKCREEYR